MQFSRLALKIWAVKIRKMTKAVLYWMFCCRCGSAQLEWVPRAVGCVPHSSTPRPSPSRMKWGRCCWTCARPWAEECCASCHLTRYSWKTFLFFCGSVLVPNWYQNKQALISVWTPYLCRIEHTKIFRLFNFWIQISSNVNKIRY